MKTDSQLQRDVTDELVWDPSIDHAHIGVAAKGGVVTLSAETWFGFDPGPIVFRTDLPSH